MTESRNRSAVQLDNALTWQELCLNDLDAMMGIEVAAHSHPWKSETMGKALERHHCWGIFNDDGLLGFAIVSRVLDEAELLDMAIHPKCQGQGLGRKLLDRVLDWVAERARRIYLEVRESNAAAIDLYLGAGFVELGVRPNYYPATIGREDALLMAMELL